MFAGVSDPAAPFLSAAEAAVDAAGAVLRRHFRRPIVAERKADDSPVTVADRQAEHAMRAVLAARHPNHSVLGEEGGFSGGAGRYCWVLDPIDGTRAFITGRPSFGTLLALLEDSAPILGIIDQPITGERWVGCAGRPTRFAGGLGGAIGARRGQGLAACELSATSPAMFSRDEAARWQALARRVGRASYGGDCYAYGLLALGQIDIVAEADLRVWDFAALAPVVSGAGGCMTDWDGAALEYSALGPQRVLALGDPALLGDVVAALRPEDRRERRQMA